MLAANFVQIDAEVVLNIFVKIAEVGSGDDIGIFANFTQNGLENNLSEIRKKANKQYRLLLLLIPAAMGEDG